MAAPRPDVKFYLDQPEHAALKVFAEIDGIGMGDLVERVMREYLRKRVHEISLAASKLERAGIVQNESTALGMGRK